MKFEFELSQRVNVPGYGAGVVIAAAGDVINGITYRLKWLDTFGTAQEGTWTASEVKRANPVAHHVATALDMAKSIRKAKASKPKTKSRKRK